MHINQHCSCYECHESIPIESRLKVLDSCEEYFSVLEKHLGYAHGLGGEEKLRIKGFTSHTLSLILMVESLPQDIFPYAM